MNDAMLATIDPEIVGSELAKVEEQSKLEADGALALRRRFSPFFFEILEWRGKVAEITDREDPTHQKLAREVRLGLRAVRSQVENTRKALKEESLRRGKAIDGFANVLKYLCEPAEEYLLAIEQYAERKEAARIALLVQERTAALVAAECDPAAYNLQVMTDATFADVLSGAKSKLAARQEAERQAEADRIAREKADTEQRARVAAENARLKKEAAEREAAMKAQQAAADATARKAKAEADAKLEAERKAREKAEKEVRDAKAREEAAARQREADASYEREQQQKKERAEREAARKAARAPDRTKLNVFADTLTTLQVPIAMSSPEATALVSRIQAKIDELANWIKTQAADL